MFQSTRKTMKWGSLIKDLKEKVGLSHSPSSPTLSTTFPSSSDRDNAHTESVLHQFAPPSSREKCVLELEFKRYWEEFRSSSSEKEKEAALNLTVDCFCRLVKQHANVAQLLTMLVETHIFSFVVGRAFVTDIGKLKITSKTRSLHSENVLGFFSEVTKDGFCPGSNLLNAVKILVSEPIDKQSLLDSGILCCLIHVLNSLLGKVGSTHKQDARSNGELLLTETDHKWTSEHTHLLEIEGSVVHIMKALASQPSAAQTLIEDDSLQLLFNMVAKGSLTVFAQYKDGIVPLHTIQLHRHAMQILGLLLVNDNGSTAKYIRKHHLIRVLLMAVKDFDPDSGDSAYTMGIVDLLLECVELSYRPEAGATKLREDIHNAHGYHFIVQFALTLSNMPRDHGFQYLYSNSSSNEIVASDDSHGLNDFASQDVVPTGDSSSHLLPTLCRLLDVLVNLSQTGPPDSTGSGGVKGSKSTNAKSGGHGRSHTSSSERLADDFWEKGNSKVKDLEGVQMLQDIFLKAESRDLQAEVLNRMFKIFSSHLENYKLCQQLRTVPLFILNMAGFPQSLQEIILKILEYAVTVVNCIPEQELLSLCCLLQQPVSAELKRTILFFFVKLLSFDQQYKKVLREVGVLEVLLDDLNQHKFLLGPDQNVQSFNDLDRKSSSSNFKIHLDNEDAIISSPKLLESGSGTLLLFEVDETVAVAWDCLVSLLKKADANQASFRSANGVTIILPYLESEIHRPGVLRIMSCLIIEDVRQVHSEELGVLVEVLKSGMVTSVLGSQYKLENDAKCDVLGALWRILGVNNSSQRVFGESTGFSLLLTILHGFQSAKETQDSVCYIRLFTYLLRVVTAGVSGNAVNRIKLHEIISSQTFFDLLLESHLLCLECEEQVTQLFFELALELVLPPFLASESVTSHNLKDDMCASSVVATPLGSINLDKEWVRNAGAVKVLIRSLLLFTPKMQLEILNIIEKLAFGGPINQEALTSVGCVELLLETIQPFLLGSSPILSNSLKIVEVLGSYRLSTSELRLLIRFILQMRLVKSGHHFVNMLERLILMQDMSSDDVSLAPFVQMDLSMNGHASIQVSLGERSWPPAAGYSFVCWFQFRNFLKPHLFKDDGHYKTRSTSGGQHHREHVLRIFSVGAVDKSTIYAELYIQEDGMLTLATSNSSCLSFSGLELVEGRWHHLAIVHSKPNALAGLFQASVAHVYLNGKLRHTGKLGYSPSQFGKSLQITIGTPAGCAKVSDLSWKLRCCYLFEEVLTPGSICFTYILGKGYKGIFQDTNLLSFVPNQACAGGSMAILDSLDADLPLVSNLQRFDSANKQGKPKAERSGIVWDMEILGDISLQLSGKRLIFAFDGTCTEFSRSSGVFSMINLVDPMSAAASPIGGIPRFGRLHGDIYICRQCVIGDTIIPIGGMAVVLALIEAAETRDMLHMALTLLACALHQNPQNVRDMQTYQGYHLLSLFLYRRMSLFDMHCLEIFFQIAACEASFFEPKNPGKLQAVSSPAAIFREVIIEDISLSKNSDEFSSAGSHGDMDDFSGQKDTFSHLSELETSNLPAEISNCIVLSNADMVEHVLLDWTLWVIAPTSIQIALLGFLEHLVSMHWYRNHNLTILRRINLVQHLLVTLQRGDVEIPVLEKLVVLLGVILEDGFLSSELEHVVRFVIMSFDPAVLRPRHEISREFMGKHVIVRNMLLEMLIDLQVTIKLEELLEQWHKIVSSKLITYFLDEGVHPTSMKWIMTLLGVCLASSPTFVIKFRTSGGYQGLARVLRSFYDSPDIYYILFRLIFGKSVYPRLPEVRMLDFLALIPSDGHYGELKFVELLESVIAMAKSTFERLSVQSMLAHETGSLSQVSAGLVAEMVEENSDISGELQGEALMHKTYAARLMGGEASAPSAATSVLRFMVDLAKMCHPFSVVCRRGEFIESCIDLYFSCARAAFALKMTKDLTVKTEKDFNKFDGSLSGLTLEQEQSVKTSLGVRCSPEGQGSMNSEDFPVHQTSKAVGEAAVNIMASQHESHTSIQEYLSVARNLDNGTIDEGSSAAFSSNEFNFHNNKGKPESIHLIDSQSLTSLSVPDSLNLSDKSNSKMYISPISSPVVALTSWLGSGYHDEPAPNLASTPSMESPVSVSVSEFDQSSEIKILSQGSSPTNTLFSLNSKTLLEIDDSAYGGGPCSAAAIAVLDFVAEVLSNLMTEQIKAAPSIESMLEIVPLHFDLDCVLVFQGLCLGRLMNFLERRLLRDDEENFKRLDKSRWSSNLDTFCWMIVDRVYMGAFPQPAGVLKILEFLLSMLQLANKDGRIEEAVPTGKGLLSIGRGNRQLDAYIHSLLKNTNRMIMYCFLPLFLISIGEDVLLSRFGLQIDTKKNLSSPSSPQDESRIDICTFLQLLVAHKEIIFCPSNLDTDLNCCLSINLTSLLLDQRRHAQQMAVDIFRYMLVHRRAGLEDLLVSKPNQGQHLGVLHGFDRLLTGSLPDFFDWLRSSVQTVNKVLDQCAAIMWSQYIAGSAKFLGVRLKTMESRRKKEVGRRSRDISKLDLRHWEQINERRYALEVVRDAMSTELRVVRQDKFGRVLHAESEWQTHLQQLVHERGIFPMCKMSVLGNPEWQLCPIEGPYRMRKKLERCKLKIDTIQCVLDRLPEYGEVGLPNVKTRNSLNVSDADPDSFSYLLTEKSKHNEFGNELYDESFFNKSKSDDLKFVVTSSSGWNDDFGSSLNDESLHSALEFGVKSSTFSAPLTESVHGGSDPGSPRQSSLKTDEAKIMEGKVGKDLNDNGEYLIRPYLEPFEKIKSRFNCERVVGLDKHDGIFLIGELSLYVIENFYVDGSGCICEKECEDELSVIDQALGVKKDVTISFDNHSKSTSSWGIADRTCVGGRAWAYNGGAWGKEKVCSSSNLPHLWRMWKLSSVHEILKRDYQLRPVAIEIFSMDGCNDLLVFHKREREEVFRSLLALNLPKSSMLDTTISGSTKQESNEGSRLFKLMAKSFSKRWQNGEISNFQYLMHLNTLAGRGYSDLTQYPVFPWVLADYESEYLNLSNPKTFRKLDKPMGCQSLESEVEFRKRYESWDDPEVPKFHYGSHYSSAGIVLFFLLRLPPFSAENQKLQGGQFDHADRLFNSIRDTWLSAAGKGNTSDVKELIPEFFYLPEFLENHFNLDFGEKQSGEKVGDAALPPWANGSAREFIIKHREALECDYVSENLHHWIDLIFGYKQRGKAAEDSVNVFYHYTYEGSVDIDSVMDPSMKSSILAQINHFGQTPKQLFHKPHVKRRSDRKLPSHPLKHFSHLLPHPIRKTSSPITQILTFYDKTLLAGPNSLLKPRTHTKYISWGFPDRSLRFLTYDQDRLLSTHENLHGGSQIHCAGFSHDGRILVTGGDDTVVSVWRISKDGAHVPKLVKTLCGHRGRVRCLHVSQPYMLVVSGSDDCTVILWDLSSLGFVRELFKFPAPVSAVYMNDLNGEIVTGAGIVLAVWSVNGECLAGVNTSQLPSDSIVCVTSCAFSDWMDTNWYVTGHESGAVKVWEMLHWSEAGSGSEKNNGCGFGSEFDSGGKVEYRLILRRVLKFHNHPVTSVHLAGDLKQLLSGDSDGRLVSWTVPEN